MVIRNRKKLETIDEYLDLLSNKQERNFNVRDEVGVIIHTLVNEF